VPHFYYGNLGRRGETLRWVRIELFQTKRFRGMMSEGGKSAPASPHLQEEFATRPCKEEELAYDHDDDHAPTTRIGIQFAVRYLRRRGGGNPVAASPPFHQIVQWRFFQQGLDSL
jgi:hypothetical protein